MCACSLETLNCGQEMRMFPTTAFDPPIDKLVFIVVIRSSRAFVTNPSTVVESRTAVVKSSLRNSLVVSSCSGSVWSPPHENIGESCNRHHSVDHIFVYELRVERRGEMNSSNLKYSIISYSSSTSCFSHWRSISRTLILMDSDGQTHVSFENNMWDILFVLLSPNLKSQKKLNWHPYYPVTLSTIVFSRRRVFADEDELSSACL